jgi:hypothetical protein
VRNTVGELQQHLVAADLLELISANELVGQCDGIDALACAIELADRSIDNLVGVSVKVLGAEELSDLVEDLVV